MFQDPISIDEFLDSIVNVNPDFKEYFKDLWERSYGQPTLPHEEWFRQWEIHMFKL